MKLGTFKGITAFIIGGLLAFTGSCTSTSPTTDLTDEDIASIYAAITLQLETVDDTFGGNLNPSILYIIRKTDDKAGNPSTQQSGSVLISATVQERIAEILRDQSFEIMWVDRFEDAEFEEVGGFNLKRGGAIITLGNTYRQTDGSVQTAGSIYIANLAAGGTTYILQKINGAWEITGRTNVTWMS